jgi:hypothetical protein
LAIKENPMDRKTGIERGIGNKSLKGMKVITVVCKTPKSISW